MPSFARALIGALILLAGHAAMPGAQVRADEISGAATYRERIALPPGAVLEAALVALENGRAAGPPLGLVRVEAGAGPPVPFVISYDGDALRRDAPNGLTARVLVDERVLFATSGPVPVDLAGGGEPVELSMRMRPPSRAAAPAAAREGDGGARQGRPRVGAHGLALPASFDGTLPCADCPGIDWHLDLWPDGTFHLLRDYQERDAREGAIGRWHAVPARRAIALETGGREGTVFLEVQGPGRLRLLDRAGDPIDSDLPYTLTAERALDPVSVPLTLEGEFRYFADAARLAECRTGRSYPVAMEGDYLALERAYLERAPEPDAPVLARIEGRIAPRPPMEGGGVMPTVIVERLVGLEPTARCPVRDRPAPAVEDGFWRLAEVEGAPAPREGPAPGREPFLLLLSESGRMSATAGCNMLGGPYERAGDRLSFGPAIASTMMACPPPLEAVEGALVEALAATRGWRIEDGHLVLLGAGGGVLARFDPAHRP